MGSLPSKPIDFNIIADYVVSKKAIILSALDQVVGN